MLYSGTLKRHDRKTSWKETIRGQSPRNLTRRSCAEKWPPPSRALPSQSAACPTREDTAPTRPSLYRVVRHETGSILENQHQAAKLYLLTCLASLVQLCVRLEDKESARTVSAALGSSRWSSPFMFLEVGMFRRGFLQTSPRLGIHVFHSSRNIFASSSVISSPKRLFGQTLASSLAGVPKAAT